MASAPQHWPHSREYSLYAPVSLRRADFAVMASSDTPRAPIRLGTRRSCVSVTALLLCTPCLVLPVSWDRVIAARIPPRAAHALARCLARLALIARCITTRCAAIRGCRAVCGWAER